MSTAFKPLEIPPGAFRRRLRKCARSNWAEVNFVRWREGQLTPMGGHALLINPDGSPYRFASRAKKIHGWFDLTGEYHIAYLCEQHLYVDTGGTLTDITPADGMAAPAGLVGGYGDLLYMNPPPPDDLYGTPRGIPSSVAITKIPAAYSLDNFGSILYAMTLGRRAAPDVGPCGWRPGGGSAPATGRGPVPHGRCFVVTQERFILIFGSAQDGTVERGFPWRFAWCDQENPGAWDYSNITSMAGFLDIEPASPIIAAIATRTGTLIWTAKKCYVSQFLGMPYIYNYVELSDACTPWSPQSMATTASLALWMTEQGVVAFDGTSDHAGCLQGAALG